MQVIKLISQVHVIMVESIRKVKLDIFKIRNFLHSFRTAKSEYGKYLLWAKEISSGSKAV